MPPEPGAELALVCTGAVAPEALKALGAVREDIPGAGLLHVTSADRLDADWRRRGRATAPPARLLAPLAAGCGPGHRPRRPPGDPVVAGCGARPSRHALGVDRFGQSADLADLYRVHGLDAGAILDACAAALLRR